MSCFGNKPTAGDLRRLYARGIRDFLAGASRFERDGRESSLELPFDYQFSSSDELPNLLMWARGQLKQKMALQQQVATLEKQVTATETRLAQSERRVVEGDAQRAALTRQLGNTQSQLTTITGEKRAMEDQHRATVNQLTTTQARQLAEMRQQHDRQLENQRVQYDQHVADTAAQQERQLQTNQLRFNQELAKRNMEIQKLKSQLLVSHDKNLAWPDEKLKFTLNEVRRLIDNATARLAVDNVVPRQQALPDNLDPSQSLARVGGRTHFWLRSKIWSMLQAAFFGLPFGFGAFGPGRGFDELLAVYAAWRRRYDGFSDDDATNGATFEIFKYSALCNKWRSVTFQSLAITSLGDPASSSSGRAPMTGVVARLGEENIQQCIQRINEFLEEVSAISGVPLYADLDDDVSGIVRLCFEVALQFGINQAQLALLTTDPGQSAVIGAEFHDCEDADEHRGMRTRVDLMVAPGLQRVGDGRIDLAKVRVVVPCEIFTAEAH
ncbi:hypothetical protein B0H63DRAFT_140782 [Podospora didyma]|uniref:Uncharacterized protein n=1 Tax=Podospora didyma TaxID=330526 RepID=A0AAE0NS98_9PEZI|nr:hypothetical protein B0H63DRAFT_140782 [Podospora didyma]